MKINNTTLPHFEQYNPSNVNLIIDLEQLSNLVKNFVACKYCGSSDRGQISLHEDFKCGLVDRVVIECSAYNNTSNVMSSKCVSNIYELNLRYI